MQSNNDYVAYLRIRNFGIAKVAIAGLVNGCGHDTMLDRNRHSHVDWSLTYSIAP